VPPRPGRGAGSADTALVVKLIQPRRWLEEDRERVIGHLKVSRETLARLDRYAELLVKWQPIVNLVAPSTIGPLWTRHILDSAQIANIGREHLRWLDLGSGAGLPGVVIAILLAERSGAGVDLIESDQRKAAFMQEAARVTGAPATVHAVRIEAALQGFVGKVTAVTARALAPLPRLLELAEPLLTSGAEGFFPKGQALDSEFVQASARFAFEMRTVPSEADAKGRVVVIRSVRRRPELGV
jgi:16S rRNA (guanine527-N7)-methyltransferase